MKRTALPMVSYMYIGLNPAVLVTVCGSTMMGPWGVQIFLTILQAGLLPLEWISSVTVMVCSVASSYFFSASKFLRDRRAGSATL